MMRLRLSIALFVLLAGCGGTKSAPNGNMSVGVEVNSTESPVPGGSEPTAYPASNSASPPTNMAEPGNMSSGGDMANVSADANGNSASNSASNAASPASERPYCDILREHAAPADCRAVQEIWQRLDRGRSALDMPPLWRRDDKQRVSFVIARDDAGEGGAPANPADYTDTAPEAQAPLRVGGRMVVRLAGEGFEIAAVQGEEQNLATGGVARWDWDVVPKQGGKRRLTVSAYVVVERPGGERSVNLIRTLSQEVTVEVGAGDRVRDAAEEGKAWLGLTNELLLALAALLGGGALAVWLAIRNFRRKREAGAAETPPTGTPSPPPPPATP